MEGMPKPEIINKARLFLEQPEQTNRIEALSCRNRKSLLINFMDIAAYDYELSEQLLEHFIETMECFQLAAASICSDIGGGVTEENKSLEVYFNNIPMSCKTPIKSIRSKEINKLISIEGVVKQATKVKPKIRSIRFECPNCGTHINIVQEDRKLKEPTRCSCGRKGKFVTAQKFMIDTQKIEIEEIPENLGAGSSEMQKVHVFLEGLLTDPSLVNIIMPGNRVVVYGCAIEIPRYLLPKDEETTITDIIFKANYVELQETTYEEVIITKEDEEMLIKLSQDPDIVGTLSKSIAPSIYGYDEIKEAILLQQLGGVKKKKGDGTVTRGNFHILLVGDPGCGKSKLLEYIVLIAPKARFTVGGGTTRAGVTAAIVRDELTGTYALEAGALVLAHKGTLALDEADKMSTEDSASLHEAMETGKVTRTGAGINASLPAETSILAAANPKLSRFDFSGSEPLAKQINMPSSLLSRFDQIFPVKDVPDPIRDSALAKHILQGHQAPETMCSTLPPSIIKKYISYAKKLEPTLTKEAVEDIYKFYVDLRSKSAVDANGSVKAIPITPRQLEAIVRMAEASAKARLSKTVDLIDVARAKKLMWYYLTQLGMTESGEIDIDKITSTVAASERNKTVLVRDIMDQIEKDLGGVIPDSELTRKCAEQGISDSELYRIIEKLKQIGEVMEVHRGEYKRI